MEYFRRIRLPEYMDTIRSVVGPVQENQLACILFVESMPPYSELTNQPGIYWLAVLVLIKCKYIKSRIDQTILVQWYIFGSILATN